MPKLHWWLFMDETGVVGHDTNALVGGVLWRGGAHWPDTFRCCLRAVFPETAWPPHASEQYGVGVRSHAARVRAQEKRDALRALSGLADLSLVLCSAPQGTGTLLDAWIACIRRVGLLARGLKVEVHLSVLAADHNSITGAAPLSNVSATLAGRMQSELDHVRAPATVDLTIQRFDAEVSPGIVLADHLLYFARGLHADRPWADALRVAREQTGSTILSAELPTFFALGAHHDDVVRKAGGQGPVGFSPRPRWAAEQAARWIGVLA